MSKQYDDTNKGALFGNTRKREGKKDPDLQGKINIEGLERWLSGWFFTYEKDGEKKRGINLAIGDVVSASQSTRKHDAQKSDDADSDIPF